MKKFGQIGRLKKEKIEEYIQLHEIEVYSEKWRQVLKTISDCNMKNYSIFIKDDLVFGYFEYVGNDYDNDMKKMAADDVTQNWWKLTRPCFEFFSTDSKEPFYEDMKQIFDYEG